MNINGTSALAFRLKDNRVLLLDITAEYTIIGHSTDYRGPSTGGKPTRKARSKPLVTRFNAAQIQAIRDSLATVGIPQTATQYGIKYQTLYNIASTRKWPVKMSQSRTKLAHNNLQEIA